MSNKFSLSIKQKILFIPLLSGLGFIVFLGLNTSVNRSNGELLEQVQIMDFPRLELAKTNQSHVERIKDLINNSITVGEIEMLDTAADLKQQVLSNIDQISALNSENTPASINGPLEQLKPALNGFFELSDNLARGMITNTVDFSSIGGRVEQKNQYQEQLQSNIELLIDQSRQRVTDQMTLIKSNTNRALQWGIFVGLGTITLLVIVSFSVVRSVIVNITNIGHSLKDIAQGEGDLTRRIEQSNNDEIGYLVRWFNSFVEKLHQTIKDVVLVIAPLAKVSQQLQMLATTAKGSSDEQMQSVDLVNNGVNTMLTQVSEISANAATAADRAKQADAQAGEGRVIVNTTVEYIKGMADAVEHSGNAIEQLSKDVENVGDILDVIRGIAEQTNLLALNAAIEAARAGDQGRGFAVVADEVRTLASRTQSSTQEIHEVIEKLQNAAQTAVSAMVNSKESADSSVEYANKTGESLESIADKVRDILHMNEQISHATYEQEQASKDIQKNLVIVSDTSKSTVENTGVMLELSNSAKELADNLNTVAVQFKV